MRLTLTAPPRLAVMERGLQQAEERLGSWSSLKEPLDTSTAL
jgi:hypothetical protein